MAPSPPGAGTLGTGLIDEALNMHRYAKKVESAIAKLPEDTRTRTCDEYGCGYVAVQALIRRSGGAVATIHRLAHMLQQRLEAYQRRFKERVYSPAQMQALLHAAVETALKRDAEVQLMLEDICMIADGVRDQAQKHVETALGEYQESKRAVDADEKQKAQAWADTNAANSTKRKSATGWGATAGGLAGGGAAAYTVGAVVCPPVAIAAAGGALLCGYLSYLGSCGLYQDESAPAATDAALERQQAKHREALDAATARQRLAMSLQTKTAALKQHYGDFVGIFQGLADACDAAVAMQPAPPSAATLKSSISEDDCALRITIDDAMGQTVGQLKALVAATRA